MVVCERMGGVGRGVGEDAAPVWQPAGTPFRLQALTTGSGVTREIETALPRGRHGLFAARAGPAGLHTPNGGGPVDGSQTSRKSTSIWV